MADLADLIAMAAQHTPGVAQGAQTVGYRQGLVKAWDTVSGTNTITVAGVDLDDVPSLVGPDSALIRAGDAVAVLVTGSQMLVLGRIALAGGTRGFGVQSAVVSNSEGTSSTSFTDLATPGPSVTVNITSARRALVWVSVLASASLANIAEAGVQVSGASTIAPDANHCALTDSPANDGVSLTLTAVINYTAADGLNEGLNTFTVKYRTPTGGPPASTWSRRVLTVWPF